MTSATQHIPTFARSELQTDPQIQAAIEEFERWGLMLLTGMLSAELITDYRNIVEKLGGEVDAGWEDRHSDLVINDVISMHPQLFDLVDDPLVITLASRLLGDNICVYMSEAISRAACLERSEDSHDGRNPTGPGLRFHQDSDGIERDLGLPVAPRFSVKAGFYLTDAREAGCGNTWAVPGSHKRAGKDEAGVAKEALHHDQGVPILASAGDVLLFDRRLWHGGSANATPNTRHAVFIGYAFRWLRPRFDTLLPNGIEGQSLLRQQLLGAGTTKGRYEAPSSEVPLKQALQAQGLQAHPHTRATSR